MHGNCREGKAEVLNPLRLKKLKVLSDPAIPDDRNSTAFQTVPRGRPYVLLVGATKMSRDDTLALIVIKYPVRTAQ